MAFRASASTPEAPTAAGSRRNDQLGSTSTSRSKYTASRAWVSAITSQRHSMKMPGRAQCGQQPVRFAWSCIACTCRAEVRSHSFGRHEMSGCGGHAAPSLESEAKAHFTLDPLQRHRMHARGMLPVQDDARAAAAVGQRVGHRRRQARRE